MLSDFMVLVLIITLQKDRYYLPITPAGKHDYFDDLLSNTPASNYIVNPGGINARARYFTFAVSYKYKLIEWNKLSVVPELGAGIMTHSQDYPYSTPTSLTFHTSAWTDM